VHSHLAADRDEEFDRPMNQQDKAVLMVMCGLFVVTCFGPLILRRMLLKLRNPNRAYPQKPALVPGAPKAFKANGEPVEQRINEAEDELTYQRRPPEIEPGGWITVQLLEIPQPTQCCSCLEETSVMREFKPATLVEIPMRVCHSCWKAYRSKQVFWTIGATLLTAAIVYGLTMLDNSMKENERVIISSIAALFGLLAGLGLATKLGAPVTFSGFNKQLNTIRIKFKNRDFALVFADPKLERPAAPPTPDFSAPIPRPGVSSNSMGIG
jgi:hypothetical protein